MLVEVVWLAVVVCMDVWLAGEELSLEEAGGDGGALTVLGFWIRPAEYRTYSVMSEYQVSHQTSGANFLNTMCSVTNVMPFFTPISEQGLPYHLYIVFFSYLCYQ